ANKESSLLKAKKLLYFIGIDKISQFVVKSRILSSFIRVNLPPVLYTIYLPVLLLVKVWIEDVTPLLYRILKAKGWHFNL
ncbi:MAG TPA: hypothetical protein PLZ10_13020, partial [Chitinophagaceae bacterium]|nr:hypothetical protein [Chitinophagaceae bacterium]